MNNLVVRSISGLLFVAIIIGCITAGPLYFAVLFGLLCGLTLWEFASLVNDIKGIEVNRFINTVAGVYLFFAFFGYSTRLTPIVVFVPYLLSVIYLLVSELYLKKPKPLENWAFAFASQIYVALPFALFNTLAFHADVDSPSGVSYDYLYPLALFVFLWLSDSGAYLFGSLLSKYIPFKLFPRISPHKSWIGSIGGGLAAIAAAIVMSHYFGQLQLLHWIGFGLCVVAFGTWGDLIESLLKRQLGIKDSGHFLPGHGGFLDRFDSFLLACPATVLFLYSIVAF